MCEHGHTKADQENDHHKWFVFQLLFIGFSFTVNFDVFVILNIF